MHTLQQISAVKNKLDKRLSNWTWFSAIRPALYTLSAKQHVTHHLTTQIKLPVSQLYLVVSVFSLSELSNNLRHTTTVVLHIVLQNTQYIVCM